MQTRYHAQATAGSDACYHRALEHMHRNHFRQATQALAEALRAAPDNPFYLSAYGLCLAREGRDLDTALRLCRLAVNMLPFETQLRVNLGKVHRLRGDNAAAYGMLLRAWEDDQKNQSAAMELRRMGVRRRPVVPFLPRSSFPNRTLGKLRARIECALAQRLLRAAGQPQAVSDRG